MAMMLPGFSVSSRPPVGYDRGDIRVMADANPDLFNIAPRSAATMRFVPCRESAVAASDTSNTSA